MTMLRPLPVPEEDPRTPRATEAERLLLQFMVTHPTCVPDVLGLGFAPELCFTRDYRELSRLVIDLRARGVTPHWHLVGAALKSSDLCLDDPVSFEGFDDGVPRPDAAGLAYFVGVLKDRHRRRRLLLAMGKARAAVADPDVPLGEALATFAEDTDRMMADVAPSDGLDPTRLADAFDVAGEGRQLAADGIEYLVDDLIPAYGLLGMAVAYAKVGKTTLSQALGAAVAMGRPFLDRETHARRVLVVASEDPPQYVSFLARHLDVDPGRMTFYRAPISLDAAGLARLCATLRDGGYGLVLISSWQAVVRGLITDERQRWQRACRGRREGRGSRLRRALAHRRTLR